jgi:membrane protease YdiL (CAAX protease family)
MIAGKVSPQFLTVIAIVFIPLAFIVAVISTNFSSIDAEKVRIGNFVLGAIFLVKGVILFGRRSMGLALTRNSLIYLCLISFPLIAILLNSSIATLLVSFDLSKVDILRVVTASIWEEVFFRAYLFALWAELFRLKSRHYWLLFVLLSGALFGVMHGTQDSSLIFAICMGIMLATVRIKTQTIFFVIGLHIINNTLSKIPVSDINIGLRDIGVIFFALVSLWIVYRMAGADQTTNPSENRQKLAP